MEDEDYSKHRSIGNILSMIIKSRTGILSIFLWVFIICFLGYLFGTCFQDPDCKNTFKYLMWTDIIILVISFLYALIINPSLLLSEKHKEIIHKQNVLLISKNNQNFKIYDLRDL